MVTQSKLFLKTRQFTVDVKRHFTTEWGSNCGSPFCCNENPYTHPAVVVTRACCILKLSSDFFNRINHAINFSIAH